ncbi:MAG: hypothetical protein P1V97_27230 [Planctomycetota bacterium]|nr:hypothetical protein [Planctomycetota bacterium]
MSSEFKTPGGFQGTVTVHFEKEATRLKRYIPEDEMQALHKDLWLDSQAPQTILGYVDVRWTPAKPISANKAGVGPFYHRLMLVAIPYDKENTAIQFVGMDTYDLGSSWAMDGQKKVEAGHGNFQPVVALRGWYRDNGKHEGYLTVRDFKPEDVDGTYHSTPATQLELKFKVDPGI